MIQKPKLARGTPFLVFNAAAFLFIVIFLLAPVMAHFVPGAKTFRIMRRS